MTSPHNQIPEFKQRNTFLWFVLGLHSVASTIREQLKPSAPAAVEDQAVNPTPDSDEPPEPLLR
jgi:hypothetical protein